MGEPWLVWQRARAISNRAMCVCVKDRMVKRIKGSRETIHTQHNTIHRFFACKSGMSILLDEIHFAPPKKPKGMMITLIPTNVMVPTGSFVGAKWILSKS